MLLNISYIGSTYYVQYMVHHFYKLKCLTTFSSTYLSNFLSFLVLLTKDYNYSQFVFDIAVFFKHLVHHIHWSISMWVIRSIRGFFNTDWLVSLVMRHTHFNDRLNNFSIFSILRKQPNRKETATNKGIIEVSLADRYLVATAQTEF